MGILIRARAAGDLAHRYGWAFRQAWRARGETDPPGRVPYETQFLPAALALQETPVSPAPRVAMWTLILFALVATTWATFGKVDVVATAHGKLIPDNRTKVVQPMEAATVKAILVAEGQRVRAGQLLVELDGTAESADSTRVTDELQASQLRAARAEAFLRAVAGGAAALPAIPGIPGERMRAEQRLLESERLEFRARQDEADADVARRGAELRAVSEVVRGLEGTVPLARRRAEDFRRLAEQDMASRHEYLELRQMQLQQEGELAAQRQKVQELEAALLEARNRKAAAAAEARRTAMDALREARQRAAAAAQELAKAQQRGRRMRLTAPVDGTVQQLAVHTLGGVVTPAQPLMVIVPAHNPLQVEAFVENRDIGFIRAGQAAEVKVETFPYTRYGTLHARVLHVSDDAIEDERRGLVYSARVALDRTTMRVDDKTVRLTPGMAVTVEVKMRRRRVIEYFLTPLLQHKNESLRER